MRVTRGVAARLLVTLSVGCAGCDGRAPVGDVDSFDAGELGDRSVADSSPTDAATSDATPPDAAHDATPVDAERHDAGVANDAAHAPDTGAGSIAALTVEYEESGVLTTRMIDALTFCDRTPSGSDIQVRLQLDDGYTVLLLMIPSSTRVGAPLTIGAGFSAPYASWSDTSVRAPAPFRRAFLPPTSSGLGALSLTHFAGDAVAASIDNTWADGGLSARVAGSFHCVP